MSKAKIIALMNNKGGVLKTTVATNIAGELSKTKKVLLVDTDQQGNVTTTFGADSNDYKYTLTEVLLDEGVTIEQAIKQDIKNLDVLPVNGRIMQFTAFGYGGNLPKFDDPMQALNVVLKPLLTKYDYIIIDSAPSMDLLSINVINAADTIYIPASPEMYSIKGIKEMIQNLSEFNKVPVAIIPTLYDARTKLHREILLEIEATGKEKGIKVTNTKITKSIRAATAVRDARKPLVLTNAKGKQIQQYKDLVIELGL